MRVLIAGGSGFLGRHLAARLVRDGHTVHATHSPRRAPPTTEGVTWIASNLAGSDAATSWPAACDAVVHLAQSRQWRSFPDGAADVVRVNVAGVQHAAEYARRADVRRFLFASSGNVYGQTERPAREEDRIDLDAPRGFYGASKLAAELLLRPYAAFFTVATLRIFTPYGPGQDGAMLIPRLVQRVQHGEPIDLQPPDGLAINPVFAADVAETFARCLALDSSVVLNVAGPEALTLRAVGQCIGDVVGRSPRFQMDTAAKAPVVVGDTAGLERRLGWRPRTAFRDGLRAWLGPTVPDRIDPRT